MRIKALQLACHSPFQSGSGRLLASTLGGSESFGGLRHAADRPVHWAARSHRARRRLRSLGRPRLLDHQPPRGLT